MAEQRSRRAADGAEQRRWRRRRRTSVGPSYTVTEPPPATRPFSAAVRPSRAAANARRIMLAVVVWEPEKLLPLRWSGANLRCEELRSRQHMQLPLTFRPGWAPDLAPSLCHCYASHCPCDFETPPWVFRYPETAPAIGSSDGDRSGAGPQPWGADPISGSRTYSGALALWAEKRPTPQG
jgi:hypothetical protein